MNRILKDALFGVVGGIAGRVVIDKLMGAMSKLRKEEEKKEEKRLVPEPRIEKLARKVGNRERRTKPELREVS